MPDPQSLLAAARDAAWSGDHAQAITICNEALTAPDLEPAVKLDLYDTRSESFFALGRLDGAVHDAEAMMTIAGSAQMPVCLAQLLGGGLTAASQEGKGSTFILSIPIRYQPKGEKM